MKNETWWTPAWKEEYMRAWKATGARKLNCYYQDNFEVDSSGFVSAPNLHDRNQSNALRAHALLIGSDSAAMFEHSLEWLARPGRGTLLHYHSVGR